MIANEGDVIRVEGQHILNHKQSMRDFVFFMFSNPSFAIDNLKINRKIDSVK